MATAVLLHLTLLGWLLAPGKPASLIEPSEHIVAAELQSMPPPLPTPAKPPPLRPPSSRSVPETPAIPDTPAMSGTDLPAPPAREPASAGDSPASTVVADQRPTSLGPVPHYAIDAPPAAELRYHAHSQHKGQNVYGGGRIHWASDGKTYRIKGEFNVLFLSLLNFSSEGTIDPKTGVAPAVYAEKRLRRAETNTHFHRERNTISFSASQQQYERPGGEQDRASVVWQLAGIGRKSGQQFVPGSTLSIAVAGVRHADVWTVRIAGIEEIETGLGKLRAWRLTRSARKDSYEQSLDVWLSPQHEWYPVKVRYTSANGDFLDLSLEEIRHTPAAAPGALP